MGTQKGRAGKVYRIVLSGELGERYAPAFEGRRVESSDGRTILTGEVKDVPHLFGILERLHDLGLQLLSVETLPDGATERGPEPKP